MYAMLLDSLRGTGQKRQRELQLGGGRAGHDARFRGNDDAVRALLLLCRSQHLGHRVRAPDIHQDEHGRGRHYQVHRNACGRVPFHYRGLYRVPRLFRLSRVGTGEMNQCRRGGGMERPILFKNKK